MFNPGESQDIEVGKNTTRLLTDLSAAGWHLPDRGERLWLPHGGAFTLILASEPPGE